MDKVDDLIEHYMENFQKTSLEIIALGIGYRGVSKMEKYDLAAAVAKNKMESLEN